MSEAKKTSKSIHPIEVLENPEPLIVETCNRSRFHRDLANYNEDEDQKLYQLKQGMIQSVDEDDDTVNTKNTLKHKIEDTVKNKKSDYHKKLEDKTLEDTLNMEIKENL